MQEESLAPEASEINQALSPSDSVVDGSEPAALAPAVAQLLSSEENKLFLQRQVEAMIFASNEPLSIAEIARIVSELLDADFPTSELQIILDAIVADYQSADLPFVVERVAGGYQFLTRTEYQNVVQLMLKQRSKRKLSTAAMETLSIIAYRQPVTKAQIEHIRGVSSDYAIQKLLEKELIQIAGKADAPGKPILYGSTRKFMEYFGLNSLGDLPQLKDFAEVETLGEPTE